ncbi:hypothetical protein [Clostridium vincentii]|uniref:Uncharacterized protein n=1 Tax=Clostridium vincentii TaxID=52704 RepID=A0A2T0BEY8_9CLOT|nr:hypothetical protein [Clostridium vincentii]PRR82428.1 hypothetical protein CLVI_17680 [Clostridium vincentii]
MKNKSNLSSILIAILFLVLTISKILNKEYILGGICILVAVANLIVYFRSNAKKSDSSVK